MICGTWNGSLHSLGNLQEVIEKLDNLGKMSFALLQSKRKIMIDWLQC